MSCRLFEAMCQGYPDVGLSAEQQQRVKDLILGEPREVSSYVIMFPNFLEF